jgi:D-3-phosphoglycerate dehydrogenase / 2-oxoglutarate reductase
MIRILNIEPENYSEEAKGILLSLGELEEAPLSRPEAINQISEFDVLIVRLRHRIDREIIGPARRLKAIVSATTGLDHIDVPYAQARGVAVLSLRGETDFLKTIPATAEHTWALLLALIRNIPPAFQSVKEGAWNRDLFRGHELQGRRLGLIGLGRVGKMVASYGLCFGMKVRAFDPFIREWFEGVEQAASLQELLSWSDVLSLHVPLEEKTEGLIGLAELSLLPKGSVIINTSRGPLISEEALIVMLEYGHLAAAALDVVTGETVGGHIHRNNPLIQYARTHDNLLITPHLAGATYESMAKTEIFMAKKLKIFLNQQ